MWVEIAAASIVAYLCAQMWIQLRSKDFYLLEVRILEDSGADDERLKNWSSTAWSSWTILSDYACAVSYDTTHDLDGSQFHTIR